MSKRTKVVRSCVTEEDEAALAALAKFSDRTISTYLARLIRADIMAHADLLSAMGQRQVLPPSAMLSFPSNDRLPARRAESKSSSMRSVA